MENINKRFRLELKFGTIIGALTVLWLLIEYWTGLHTVHHELFLKITTFVFLIPCIGIYVAILRNKRYHLENKLTIKQSFLSGFVITIVFSCLASIGQYLYHQFINPFYFDLMISKSAEEGISQEQAAQYFNTSSYVSSVFGTYFIVGILASLISSIILKR